MTMKKLTRILAILLCITGTAFFLPGASFQSAGQGKDLDKKQEVFRTTIRETPLLSCRYFDEASFLHAVAKATVYQKNSNGLQGGILPHHLLAAELIASFWKTAAQQKYDLIVLIGPDHNRRGKTTITTVSSGFSTLYGDVEADKPAVGALIRENLASEDPTVMEEDHSISSHIPFVRYYMPDTPIVPLLVKGSCTPGKINALSDKLLESAEGKKVLFVASMDFSHYLSLEKANEMDRITEEALSGFAYEQIQQMTNDHLDSRPSALFLLHTMAQLNSRSMVKWAHSNSDIISKTITGYTTSYFVFGFLETPEITQIPTEDFETHIIAVGDVLLGRGVTKSMKAQGQSFLYPFLEVRDILKQGDIVFANLEQPVTEREESLDKEAKYILKSGTEAMAGIQFAGFNLLSLANNHIMDYYEKGLADTLTSLERNGIAYAGAGKNLEEAWKPAILEKSGLTIGLLACTDMAEVVYPGNPPIKFAAGVQKAGVAPLDPEKLEKNIKEVREQVDLLIVSLHWGVEDSYAVTPAQKKLAHRLCDLGVDMILGHHPHRFQEVEIYNGKPILYSLGNFIFDQPAPESREAFILDFTYTGTSLTQIKAIPVRTINQTQVVVQKGADSEKMLKMQAELSRAAGTACHITEDCLFFEVGTTGNQG